MKTITVKTEKMLADTLTPVSVYLKIRDVFPKSLLLESNDFHHHENSCSFICMSPMAEFIVADEKIKTRFFNTPNEKEIANQQQVLTELHEFINSFDIIGNEYSFNGFFGYCSYNAVRYFETIAVKKCSDQSAIPDLYYGLYRFIISFNHFKNEITLLENIPGSEISQLDKVKRTILNGKISNYPFEIISDEKSNFTDNQFVDIVKKAKGHCNRGDVFQVVLSRRFERNYLGDDFNVYRQLRSLNPSPYLFYFDYGSFRLMGSSPESQIEIKNRKAYINPIAGTYQRTGNDEKDKYLAQKLIEDPKENAEHVMLVYLARNDLSRNARNVKVENFKEIHYYSHVIHIVSKVSGELTDDSNLVKLMADTFPAGTLTGAPKYKAMQLIDNYEPTSRGFYGGSIGFIGFNGDVNHAIMIRTMLSKNNTLYYQAGAGIVSKSNEIAELNEVNHKLGVVKQAIQKAHVSVNKSQSSINNLSEPVTSSQTLITNH